MQNTTGPQPRFALSDVAAAVGLMTRLPVRVDTDRATRRGARAAWAWPVAGLLVGGLAALLASLALWLGLPPALAAILLIATQITLTGALHEDGLADSLDGLWGGWTRDRRLEIMKDSRIGAYGVIGLILTLLLRWQLWSLIIANDALWAAALIMGAVSRAPMAALMVWLPPARTSGLSRHVGRPAPVTAIAAGMLAGVVTLLLWPVALLALGLAVASTAYGWGRIAHARIGGQTGDILGAGQQLCDIAGLLVLAVLLT
ncbi:adenosylcobinamide-GDP ribazoletransferase [Loktanella sp. TSTF-M6]|uniref:Adenosylcobinamide-GDP ribazoletransferase n=1 Tax=Loktanella gaetbuli TaxID=2881335 RepID=A0ABS8BVJ7_9RHOB|nr:adenosylcobinamide-GDP ribazoletransferase [Loktanella gaetbuli]MCB5199740.1 adenosylcobinamide-GDP ribazoletransferase [Loktanella gaetbuli]